MAAPRQPPQPQNPKPLEVLPQSLNDVAVQIGRIFKSASKDGKDGKFNTSIVNVVNTTKIPSSIEAFNSALDDLEMDILKAKATLQRDLNQLRANRRQGQRVAPPAPMMSIDLSSPKMSKATAPTPPTTQGSPFKQFSAPNNNSNRAIKQESKPVAPFPNMGFDLTASPEVTPVPIPSPKALPKPKNSPRPSAAAKPSPVRKETKIPPPQPPRSASGSSQVSPLLKKATPAGRAQAQSNQPPKQTPVPIPTVPTKQTPVPVPNIPPPKKTPAPIPVPQPAPVPPVAVAAPAPVQQPALPRAPAPVPPSIPAQPTGPPTPVPPARPAPVPPTTGAESIFTDMTFSLAPPETPGGGPQANQPKQQPPEIDLVALGAGGGAGAGGLSSFNMDNLQPGGAPPAGMGGFGPAGASVDEKIDNLFDLGSGMDNIDMNYDLGDNGDNGGDSFNDMFQYGMNDDNNMTTNQYDNTFFGIE